MRASAFAGIAVISASFVLALGLTPQPSPPRAVPIPSPSARLAPEPATPEPTRPIPRGDARVSGTVIGQDGQGLPGLAVTLTGLAGHAGSALTDAQGAFSMLVVSGTYDLRVAGPAVVGAILPEVRAPQANLRVVVARKVTLHGVVLDGGKPVAGATVEVGGSQLAAPREVTSGADGTFALVELPEGAYAVAARHGPRGAFLPSVPRAWPGPWEPLLIQLAPAAVIAGHVLDEAGAPVAGARLVLAPEEAEAAARRAQSDDAGAFRFEGVPPGAHSLDAVADGYLPPPAQLALARADATLEVRVTVARGAVVSGRVVDLAGAPVAGAEIELAGDADGKRTLVSASERARRLIWAAGAVAAAPSARLLPVGELGVLLGPIPRIPPPGARPATPAAGPATRVASAAGFVTDAAGGFSVAAVPPGRYTVRARHPDFADGAAGPIDAGAIPVVTQVVLVRGVEVAGHVTDEQNQPIFGAQIAVRDGDRRLLVGFSGADGSYRLEHVTGDVVLEAAARGHGSVSRPLGAEPLDGARVAIDFVLPAAGLAISGVVRDDEDRVVEGAVIEAPGAGAARSDAGGRFTLVGVAPGQVRLRVHHDRYPAVTVTAEGGASDVELILPHGGALELDLRDGNTSGPLLVFTVRGRGPGDAAFERPGTRGELTVAPLTAGRWLLTIESRGYATRQLTVDVAAGDPTHQRLELFQGATVGGTVYSQYGDAVAGARVRAGLVEGTTDRLGGFKLTGVPHGDTEISVSHPAEGRGSIVVPLHSGDEALTLQIRLSP